MPSKCKRCRHVLEVWLKTFEKCHWLNCTLSFQVLFVYSMLLLLLCFFILGGTSKVVMMHVLELVGISLVHCSISKKC